MKYAIAVALLGFATAASAQNITISPNPGTCLGSRCGYLGSDGTRIDPSPNGGYTISRPPPPPPPIYIPRIQPYQPYQPRGYGGGYDNDDDN